MVGGGTRQEAMSTHYYSGQVAHLLHTTEPALNDLIRRRKLDPVPEVVAGRRLWNRDHILQAAKRLGVPEASVLSQFGEVPT
jgi:hypothetical protein